MKSIVKQIPPVSGSLAIAVVAVIFAFSCTKTNDTTSGNNTAVKYCKTMSWNDTNGRTGTFIGSLGNVNYELTSVSYKEPSTTGGSVIFSYDASGHLMNQPGLTVTYNQDQLVKYVVDLSFVSKSTGTSTYSFDTNGYLTNISDVGSDENGPFNHSIAYTYDSNGDPVHIVSHGNITVAQGTATIDNDIRADYLTDKPEMIAFSPIAVPFTVYFTYGQILGKHLINKLVIKQNETSPGITIPELDFTQQYTYSYDSNGRVSTMYHSGNPNNIYSFTYSGCN
jgi:hypothetical protein